MSRTRFWGLLQFIFIVISLVLLSYIIYFNYGSKQDREELKKTPYITQKEVNKYQKKIKELGIVPLDSFNGGLTLKDKYMTGDISHVKSAGLLGDVEIPKLNLSEQLRLGDSALILKYSLGLVRGSDVPDVKKGTSSLIAGHRGYSGISDYFLYVDRLNKGDKIYINQPQLNRRLVYAVSDRYIISPNERDKIKKDKDKSTIHLITCTPMFVWSDRLIIDAELESVEKL